MSIRDNAYAKIPGYTARATVLRYLGVSRVNPGTVIPAWQHQPTVETAREQVRTTVEQLILAGEPIPADIAQPVIDAENSDALGFARTRAIMSVASDYGLTTPVSEGNVGAAFKYLADALTKTIKLARDHANELDGVQTAADAIGGTTAQLTAWKALTTLAEDYAEIRDTQYSLFKDAGTLMPRATFDLIALYADAIDVLPHWVELRRVNSDSHGTRDVVRYSTWMTDAVAPIETAHLEPEYALTIIATHTTPWAPTIQQYITATDAAGVATSTLRAGGLHTMEDARARYYQTTGAKPLTDISQISPRFTSTRGTGPTAHGKAARAALNERLGNTNNLPDRARPTVPIGGH